MEAIDKRLEALRNAPLDSWLMWDGDEIVATADTYEELRNKTAGIFINNPLISKTPPDWTPRIDSFRTLLGGD